VGLGGWVADGGSGQLLEATERQRRLAGTGHRRGRYPASRAASAFSQAVSLHRRLGRSNCTWCTCTAGGAQAATLCFSKGLGGHAQPAQLSCEAAPSVVAAARLASHLLQQRPACAVTTCGSLCHRQSQPPQRTV
jgi:hypothetical protein